MSWADDNLFFADEEEDLHDEDETVVLFFTDKKAETDKARLLVIDGDEVWVPKSLTGHFEQTGKGFDKGGRSK